MGLRFQQKLIIPTSSRPLVVRGALLSQLEQAITTKRVVALAAPAGWGKTTALAQLASESRLPMAWYTLDASDRDPQLFLDYLLHTVAAFVPSAETIVTQLATIAPRGLPELIQAAALAIAAAPEPFVLVFDDFHVLEEQADAFGFEPTERDRPREPDHGPEPPLLPGTALVLDLLASIGEYAANCHLVFASRTLPALHGLVRMVAQQRAAVFDYTALQFSATDVQRLAGMAYNLALSDDSADQLIAHLGGWVTGIVLSLDQAHVESVVSSPLSVVEHAYPQATDNGQRTHDHASRFTLHGATQREVLVAADTSQVYAFFAEQIIAPLPADLRRFLEETSVLEDLSPRRCDTLRRSDDSALFLDEVKRHGLFVSSRAGWLAYHSLFRDFLRVRLARDPQRWRALRRRAGDLYRDEEDLEQALDCYLAADAEGEAFALLRVAIPRFRRRSRQTTLLACFERLGQDRVLPPDLLLAQARVYSDLALWERAYLAIQLVETIGDDEARCEARILYADLLNLQGNVARARLVLDEVAPEGLPPRLRLEYYVTAGRAQIVNGEIPAAIGSLEQAHTLTTTIADSAEDPSALADIYDNLGLAYAMQGDRAAALRHLKRADACWQAPGNSGRRALTLNNLGTLATEEGRYAEARTALESGLAIAQQTTRRREETVLRCSLAELDIVEGDLEQALARFTEAHSLAVRMEVLGSIQVAAAGALWAAALQGDTALAQAWLDVASANMDPSQPEVRGRKSLGHSLLLLQRPHPCPAEVADLAADAAAVEAYLTAPERAYAALLRATITFERTGWPRADAEWAIFAARAATLPDALLLRFVPPHRRLFVAAATSAPLARRLLDITERPVPRRWKINALGAFTCLVDDAACDLSPLHRALLVRLLDAGPQGLTVERLWEAVWGDSEISMPALHQALRRLRVQTGLAVAARDGHVAIRSLWDAIDYDARAFERALETPTDREAMQQAIALYRGDFLPSAPLSAALWADTRRAHIQQRYLDALEQLAQSAEHDAPHIAIHYYQQVLQIDGCRERTAAQLMRLAARFGNRTLVYATFEHLKGSLRILGATPEPATDALYQQLH
jgi:ATP/maltotriose-dependent transcriptional regulator MalT